MHSFGPVHLILPWACLLALSTPIARADEHSATAFYRGEINAENNDRLFDSVRDRAIRRLLIDSPGGEVIAGIALGRWISRNAIDVVVEHQCLSSCANYVFPAGRRKIIGRNAVVAWHGNYHHLQATGLWVDDIESRMARTGEDRDSARARVERQMQDLVRREREFFRAIGVDQRLCWVGKMPPYSAPDYFTMSADDMLRFGVRSVTVEGNPRVDIPQDLELDIRWISLEHRSP